jgi:hypothetical protein
MPLVKRSRLDHLSGLRTALLPQPSGRACGDAVSLLNWLDAGVADGRSRRTQAAPDGRHVVLRALEQPYEPLGFLC